MDISHHSDCSSDTISDGGINVDVLDDDSIDDHDYREEEEVVQPVKKKTRGVTTMKSIEIRLRNNNGRPLHIDFDANKNPIGDERPHFVSYIGYLGRCKVKITYASWKLVKDETKKRIWRHLLTVYNVPANEAYKKFWLNQIRKRWKDFKYTLTSDYIHGEKKNKNPCVEYPWIPVEDWGVFVASRLDPKFKALSEANKKKKALNLYTHYLSRGGYWLLEQKMIEDKKKKMQEAARSNSSIVDQGPDRIDRHILWMNGRVNGEGEYINSTVAEVANKIVELEEQSRQGSFTQIGRMDILATAIGKPDHRGEVRGVSRGMGLRRYFGALSSSHKGEPSQEVVDKIKKDIEEKLYPTLHDKIMKDVQAMIRVVREQAKAEALAEYRAAESLANSSTKSSNNPVQIVPLDDRSPNDNATTPSTLSLDVPSIHVVAEAMMHLKENDHHNQPIPNNLCKVSMTQVIPGEEQGDIPIHDTDVKTQREVIGQNVQNE